MRVACRSAFGFGRINGLIRSHVSAIRFLYDPAVSQVRDRYTFMNADIGSFEKFVAELGGKSRLDGVVKMGPDVDSNGNIKNLGFISQFTARGEPLWTTTSSFGTLKVNKRDFEKLLPFSLSILKPRLEGTTHKELGDASTTIHQSRLQGLDR